MSKEESWIISIGKLHTTIYNQDQKIADLEAKLTEKEENCFDLQQRLVEKEEQCRECKHLNKKIELNIKNKLLIENAELKQQLAKKEEQVRKSQEMYFETLKEYDELEDNFTNTSLELWAEKTITQDKISFAVEQLEKVKDFCDGMKWAMVHLTKENTQTIQTVLDEIDNQIKQLKEMK